MTRVKELRTSTLAGATVEENKLVGYAARFDSPTVIGNKFREVIKRGAFRNTLEKNDVRALYDHNTSLVLGRVKSGTLQLNEDDIGLRFEIDLPDTQTARDLAESVKRGDIDGCSFGFYIISENRVDTPGEMPTRELLEVDLFEISITPFPAYESTTVSYRSEQKQNNLEIDEQYLKLLLHKHHRN